MDIRDYEAEYRSAVLNEITFGYTDYCEILYNGKMHNVYETFDDEYICATPIQNFRIPPQIIELVKLSSIGRLHTIPIKLKIKMKWRYGLHISATCKKCNNLAMQGTFCITCIEEVPDNIIRRTSCEVNVMEWIQFASETSRMNSRFLYYVNCNLDSPDYGKILGENKYFKIVDNVYTFINNICAWVSILSRYSTKLAIRNSEKHLNEICNLDIITAACVAVNYRMYDHPSYRFILEHVNDVLNVSPELLHKIIEEHPIMRDNRYVKNNIHSRIGNKLFSRFFIKCLHKSLLMWFVDDTIAPFSTCYNAKH